MVLNPCNMNMPPICMKNCHIRSYSDWLYKSYDPYINDQILHSCTAILHVITKHISPTIIPVITSKPLSISLEMVNGNTNIVIQEFAM